jgi:3-oxoacyl-[acyl-carrier-protein] synthase-1
VPRVFITGIGIISAVGFNSDEVLQSLRKQRTGIGALTTIDSEYRDEIPVGEIKASNEELCKMAEVSVSGNYTRTALLGLLAAREAVTQAGLNVAELSRAALISGTTVGGMDRSEKFYKDFLPDNNKGKLRNVIGHDCGDSTERIADSLGIGGFLSTLNTACSSSANAIMLGARLIKQGKAHRVIAGGTDSLTKFTINGFNSLMILDRQQCKPFDENRNGLNLGEGSGFLVLESEDALQKKSKPILGEVKGYGNACDAYHQTASSPEGHGAYLSMQKALEIAALQPDDISYINTHGTGTKNNDLSEGVAIDRLFTTVPSCSSTKAYTGHTLGAAGAIEAVISILSINNNCIFPNLNFSEKMQELKFSPIKEVLTNVLLRHIMSNSFGFGGNNTSLIFSQY